MKSQFVALTFTLGALAQDPAPSPRGHEAAAERAVLAARAAVAAEPAAAAAAAHEAAAELEALRARLGSLTDSHPSRQRTRMHFDGKLHSPPAFAFMPDYDAPGGESYERGSSALYRGDWEEAIQRFEQAAKKGPKADGALYWKAWAEHKAGRKDAALATLTRIKTEHPQSRWSNDAEALAVEVRQSSGEPVSPEALQNEEIKLYAINGLVNSEPERALPMLQKIVAGPGSPKLRQRALFVLAQIPSPQARETLVQLAQGQNANPDMQYHAVRYLGQSRDKEVPAVLARIYGSSSDVAIKRQILHAYSRHKARERLIEVATGDKEPALRKAAAQELAGIGDAKALIEVARKETDPAVKKEIVRALSGMKSKEASDYLIELLSR